MTLTDDGTSGISMERSGGVALWRQIAERLKADIRAGVWGQGAKLPAEAELAQRFGVNRHTIRRAVAELGNEGLVSSRQGRGTFVESAPISYPIGSRTRFSEIISRQAREPGGRLIASFRETAAPWLTDKLQLPAGAALHRIETLHVADGIPVSLSTAWFPAARFPDLVQRYAETGSVTKALAAHGSERLFPGPHRHLGPQRRTGRGEIAADPAGCAGAGHGGPRRRCARHADPGRTHALCGRANPAHGWKADAPAAHACPLCLLCLGN